jgi:hypothetical protein
MLDTDVEKAAVSVKQMTSEIVPALSNCLDRRLGSFQDTLYTNMMWVDPANWKDDAVLPSELEALNTVATHFAEPLQFRGYDHTKVKNEWKDLKHTVKYYYSGVQAFVLWTRIFQYRSKQFPNICLLVELILSLGPSNSVVEAGFSMLTAMLSDRRLSLKHETMENLLMIKVNHLMWNDLERGEILEVALAKYMEKRRKIQIDATPPHSACLD